MSASKIVLRIVNICFSMLIIVVVAYGLMKLGQKSYEFGYRVFTETSVDKSPGTDKSVIIDKGMNAKDVGDLLKDQGLIKSSGLFIVQLEISAYAGDIKPGTYILNTSMTTQDMMKIMAGKQKEAGEQKEAGKQKEAEKKK